MRVCDGCTEELRDRDKAFAIVVSLSEGGEQHAQDVAVELCKACYEATRKLILEIKVLRDEQQKMQLEKLKNTPSIGGQSLGFQSLPSMRALIKDLYGGHERIAKPSRLDRIRGIFRGR